MPRPRRCQRVPRSPRPGASRPIRCAAAAAGDHEPVVSGSTIEPPSEAFRRPLVGRSAQARFGSTRQGALVRPSVHRGFSVPGRPAPGSHGADWPGRGRAGAAYTAGRESPAVSRRAAWSLLGILSVAAGLAGAELLVTATALPSIVQDLASWQELRQASWIVDGFFVTSVAVMPIAGRAADRFGLVAPLTVALGVFGVASLAAGAAP